MNTYADILKTIFSLPKGRGANHSLASMEKLCEALGHPQKSYPVIHVAGTNGKGSVCTKIATALGEEGYTVALYTSPHIATFRERIQIYSNKNTMGIPEPAETRLGASSEMISEDEISTLFAEVQKHALSLNIPVTFFEITTLLAFLYFQRRTVDAAVIETGLGGTWDATNVVHPILSVITSIGLDHTDLLGRSIEEIAHEKAGIMKPKVPVVIGPDTPVGFLQNIAKNLGCPLFQNIICDQDFDVENEETARLALSLLHNDFPISDTSLLAGLSKKPPCRFERHRIGKEVVAKELIFDVAHNAHGFVRLLQKLEHSHPHSKYRFVVGFSKGKDIEECVNAIQRRANAVHLVSGSHPRLARAEEIEHFFTRQCPVCLEKTIDQGMRNALSAPSRDPEIVIVTGSFFIMSEAKKSLGLGGPEDPSCKSTIDSRGFGTAQIHQT